MSRGAGRVAGRADGRMASGRAAPGRRPPARGQRPLAWLLLPAASRQWPTTGHWPLVASGHSPQGGHYLFALTCSQPRRSGPERLGSGHCGVALITPSPPRWVPCCCSSPPTGEVSFHSRRVGTLCLMPGVHACQMLLLGACGHACSVVSEPWRLLWRHNPCKPHPRAAWKTVENNN